MSQLFKRTSKFSISLTLAVASVFSFSAPAHATLTSYTGSGNVGLVYSSVSNVTWTQDANLFKTLYTSNANLISQIVAVTPTYNDPSWGVQTIDPDDFFTSSGKMTWWGAQAWVNYLNSISYGGGSQWRLPSAAIRNPQYGYNHTGSEFSQLFFSELGGTAGSKLPNTDAFSNEQASAYWSTEYEPFPYSAWVVFNINGFPFSSKLYPFYAWAVSTGQLAAVPVPAAVWLFGTGLVGLAGLKRRQHAG